MAKPRLPYENFCEIFDTMKEVPRKADETQDEYILRMQKKYNVSEGRYRLQIIEMVLRKNPSDNEEAYRMFNNVIDVRQANKSTKTAAQIDLEPVHEDLELNEQEEPCKMTMEEILFQIMRAISVEQPWNGYSSIDRLSVNICGSLKKILNEIQSQTKIEDAHFCNLAEQVANLAIDVREIKKHTEQIEKYVSDKAYLEKVCDTFGKENIKVV